jgi:hypothetical protein
LKNSGIRPEGKATLLYLLGGDMRVFHPQTLGIDAVVNKPVRRNQIAKEIRELLDRTS